MIASEVASSSSVSCTQRANAASTADICSSAVRPPATQATRRRKAPSTSASPLGPSGAVTNGERRSLTMARSAFAASRSAPVACSYNRRVASWSGTRGYRRKVDTAIQTPPTTPAMMPMRPRRFSARAKRRLVPCLTASGCCASWSATSSSRLPTQRLWPSCKTLSRPAPSPGPRSGLPANPAVQIAGARDRQICIDRRPACSGPVDDVLPRSSLAADGCEPQLCGRHAQQLVGRDREVVGLELVEDAERLRHGLLRCEDLVAGQVDLPLDDPEPPGLGDLLDRVAEPVRPLHAHGVGAELVVQRDGLPDLRPRRLIAPVVVEPTREAEIADQLLCRNVQLPGAGQPQRPRPELVLGGHGQVRLQRPRGVVGRQMLLGFLDR